MAAPESVVKDLLKRLNAESLAPAERPILSEPSRTGLEKSAAGGEAIAMAGLREAIASSKALENGLLEAVKVAKSLLLPRGWIGDKGISALARAFNEGNISSLLHLDLSDNGISEQGFGAMADVLRAGVLSGLEHLNLSHNLIREEGSQMLARILEIGRLPSLQHLNLSHCYIGDKGVKSLRDAMQSGHFSSWSLQFLNLSANGIGEEGVVAILNVLSIGRLPYLKHLDMSYNMFREAGTLALGSALNSGHLSGITHLLLSRCNLGGGAVPIWQALEAGRLPNLEFLDMSYNYLGDQGTYALAGALRSGNLSKLQHFVVSECGIAPHRIASITEAVEVGHVWSLQHLDFSNNFSLAPSTGPNNFSGVSSAASDDSTADLGSLSLARLIGKGHLNGLQDLNLSQCSLTDAGLIALAEKMELGYLPKLQRFVLRDNDIRSEQSIRALLRALESDHLPDLQELDLGHNSIGDDVTMVLASALEDSSIAQSPLAMNLKEKLWSQKGPLETMVHQLLKFVEIHSGLKLVSRGTVALTKGNFWNRYFERQSSHLIVNEEKEFRSKDKLLFNLFLVCVWFLAVFGTRIFR